MALAAVTEGLFLVVTIKKKKIIEYKTEINCPATCNAYYNLQAVNKDEPVFRERLTSCL